MPTWLKIFVIAFMVFILVLAFSLMFSAPVKTNVVAITNIYEMEVEKEITVIETNVTDITNIIDITISNFIDITNRWTISNTVTISNIIDTYYKRDLLIGGGIGYSFTNGVYGSISASYKVLDFMGFLLYTGVQIEFGSIFSVGLIVNIPMQIK
jgi:hypothetical protein